jgi:hypothetical protein
VKPSLQALALVISPALVGFLFGAGPPPADAPVNAKQFHGRLLKIAEIYPVYGRVDDEARWAPTFCRAPFPPQARYSRSTDDETHGKKLYSLFARDRVAYLKTSAPVAGQVIVKESWVPVELEGKPKVGRLPPPQPRKSKPIEPPRDLAPIGTFPVVWGEGVLHPFAEKAGKWYKADRRGDLFIMMKLDPKTAGTDDGWVYGTVTADGKTVTSAGRVASCMKCHETKSTRLFGLRQPEEKKAAKP